MTRPLFLRTDARKYSRLGVRRRNKQVYRKPKGGENKIRLNKKGHWRKVKVGFRSAFVDRYKLDGLVTVMIYNVSDLEKVKSGQVAIVGKVGMKNKIKIVKRAKEKNIDLGNVSDRYTNAAEVKISDNKKLRIKILERRKKKIKKEEKKEEKKEKAKEEKIEDKVEHKHEHKSEHHEDKEDIK